MTEKFHIFNIHNKDQDNDLEKDTNSGGWDSNEAQPSLHFSYIQKQSWFFRKYWVLKQKPWWIVSALLFWIVVLGLGLWGVIAASATEYNSRVDTAYITVNEKALNVKSVISSALNPCITMATLIQQDPLNWTSLNQTFYKVAISVVDQSPAFFNIQLVPNAIIMSLLPITGFEKAITLDLLKDPAYRPVALKAISLNSIVMDGPTMLVIGIEALVGRYPVFVSGVDANETFDFQSVLSGPPTWGPYGNGTFNPGTFNRSLFAPDGGNCSVDLCYRNATRSKFWGFVEVVVGWEKIKDLAGLYDLCSRYDFVMTYTDQYGNPNVPIAMCDDIRDINTTLPSPSGGYLQNGTLGVFNLADILSKDPVVVEVSALNNEWTLWVVDKRGWTPSYKTPLIFLVVFGSILLVFMVLLFIASHLEQNLTLAEQKAINQSLQETKAILEEEKSHTDALIKRQLDLISCFGTTQIVTRKGSGEKDYTRASMEASTIERIEAVRQQLNTSQNDGDDIHITALLGSGSFGKVYRGLWKGSEVAVKTIVLPANMGASAKQERMAIMEAAISSSLTHPNIVQTYTYSIKPIKDTVNVVGTEYGSTAVILSPVSDTSFSAAPLVASNELLAPISTTRSDRSDDNQIFSYEVRLVLEYCNLGCLRDALDAGIFFSSCGFNFQAVLDTAADIARAMVHLHRSNVLHMDLKSLNIMLTSHLPGPEGGRGFIAKVADFGLSVSLDSTQSHMSSLFQGTLTHMAPEVIMKGTASKASDVYAFGITMWELATGQRAFSHIPAPHLGHAITSGKQRPLFSVGAPSAYKELAQSCWQEDPDQRPTFVAVLDTLMKMREHYPGFTQPLDVSKLSSLSKTSPTGGLIIPPLLKPQLPVVAEVNEVENSLETHLSSVDVGISVNAGIVKLCEDSSNNESISCRVGSGLCEDKYQPTTPDTSSSTTPCVPSPPRGGAVGQVASFLRHSRLSAPPLSPSAFLNTTRSITSVIVLGSASACHDGGSSEEVVSSGPIGKPLDKVSELGSSEGEVLARASQECSRVSKERNEAWQAQLLRSN